MEDCPCIDYDLDFDAQPRLYRKVRRRAARTHRCCECGEAIARGELHEYVSGLWDGSFMSFRTCDGCANVRDTLSCGGFLYGALWDAMEANDLLRADTPPRTCVLNQLDEAGAAKVKAAWMRAVRQETGA